MITMASVYLISFMKVIACLPVHGRLPLLALTIQRLLKKNGCAEVICAGDTVEEEWVVRNSGGIFVYHCNSPLGSKWNAAFVMAREFTPDACLFIGSGGWISERWIDYMYPYLSSVDMVGKKDFNMAHVRGHSNDDGDIQVVNWGGYLETGTRYGDSIGIGRLLGRNILERMDYRPFNPVLECGMDKSMREKVQSLSGKVLTVELDQIQSLDISCDEWRNKHSFLRESEHPNATKIVDVDTWINRWGFDDIYEFFHNDR